MRRPIRDRSRPSGLLLRAVPFAWLAVFFLAPFAVTLRISVSTPATAQPPYRPVLDWAAGVEGWWAFVNALDLTNYRMLAADSLYREAFAESMFVAGGATLVLVLVGVPLAHAIARADARWQPILVALVVVPFWTSFLVRVYAWIAILKPEGLLNAILLRVGLIQEAITILDTPAGVLIGLCYAYLPFMVLPLYAVMRRIDPALREAAADLGAPQARVFREVTLPLSLPGLAAGALLCFIPMFGEYVIPDILGGSESLMLGRMLWLEFFANRDWPIAAAVAVVLLLLLTVPLVLVREAEQRRADALR